MLPAALSILTTTFEEGPERHTALGVWAGGGRARFRRRRVSRWRAHRGPGWRWVLFVNPLACVLVLPAVYALIPGDRRRARFANFDVVGGVLGHLRDAAARLRPGRGA